MKVGKRINSNPDLIERTEKVMKYAVDVIKRSKIAPYVKHLYLYGSCARGEQTYESDVDLFMELSEEFRQVYEEFRSEVHMLKGEVSPLELWDPEVELKVVIGDSWRDDKMLFYENVKREGIDIWN